MGCGFCGCQQQGEALSPGGTLRVEERKGGELAWDVSVLGPLEQSTMDDGFNNRKVGGWFLLGENVSGFSRTSGGRQVPGLVEVSRVSAFIVTWASLCVRVCVPMSPSYKDPRHLG